MKTISVRIVKKKTQNTENHSKFVVEEKPSAAKRISSNIKGWIDELRERKDSEKAKSFNLLAKVTR